MEKGVDHIMPQEGQHWVSPTFLCRLVSGVPAIREPHKCADMGWFMPEDAPENLTHATRVSLHHYRKLLSSCRTGR
jgi:hypothetical protein